MKKGYGFLLGSLLAAGLASGAPGKPLKLADGVWAMTTSGGANAGWLTFGESVIVVDSGRSADDAREMLSAIEGTAGKKPVSYLILTNNFGPHATGASVFSNKGATVICHEKFAGETLGRIVSEAPISGMGAAAKPPSILSLSQRLILADAARQVEIDFGGPADSGGDLVVSLPREQILFSGDLVVNSMLPPLFSKAIDPDGWIRTLSNLTHVKFKQLVPGYGPIGSTNGLRTTFAYLTETWDVAQKIAKENTPESFIATRLQQPDAKVAIPSEMTAGHVQNVTALVKWLRERDQKAAEPKKP